MESRHQHDTLDQIITKALDRCEVQHPQDVAEVVRDALLAEGDTVYRTSGVYGNRRAYAANPRHQNGERGVWLLVGVGCGNAKKDTPAADDITDEQRQKMRDAVAEMSRRDTEAGL